MGQSRLLLAGHGSAKRVVETRGERGALRDHQRGDGVPEVVEPGCPMSSDPSARPGPPTQRRVRVLKALEGHRVGLSLPRSDSEANLHPSR